MECTSVLAAEMEAMVWGDSIATSEGWRDVIWSSDSTTLMREINSSAGPDNWDIRRGVLQIKDKCSCFNWKFCWNSRSSIGAADSVAKIFLGRNLCFAFDSFSVKDIPFDVAHVLFLDLPLERLCNPLFEAFCALIQHCFSYQKKMLILYHKHGSQQNSKNVI